MRGRWSLFEQTDGSRYWRQCYFGSLSGESTIQFPAISSACAPFHKGPPYQTAGSMCWNPPPSFVQKHSAPLSSASVLNTRHIRVTLLSRGAHVDTIFPFERRSNAEANSKSVNAALLGCVSLITRERFSDVFFETC